MEAVFACYTPLSLITRSRRCSKQMYYMFVWGRRGRYRELGKLEGEGREGRAMGYSIRKIGNLNEF